MRELLEYETSQDVSTPTLSRAIYSIALRNDEPLKFLKLVVINIEFSQETVPSSTSPSELHDNIGLLSQIHRWQLRGSMTSKVRTWEELAFPNTFFSVGTTVWIVFSEHIELPGVDVGNAALGLDRVDGCEGIEVEEISVYLIRVGK